MKAKKIALAILLSVLMVVSFALVACKKDDEPTKIDLRTASQWSNDRDETVYDVTNDANGNLVMEYDTNGAYQYVKRTLAEQPEQLAKMKTLVFTASTTSTSQPPIIILKLEGGDEAVEIKFEISSTSKTYEWNVSDLHLDTRSRILLFADGPYMSAQGKLTITEFYFTADEINTANEITPYVEPTPEAPKNVTWNEIKADALTVNAGWYDAGNGVYTITKNSDNSYKFAVTKKNLESHKWPAALAFIYGDTLKTVKSFKITVKGKAGDKLMVKPFDANTLEKTFTLTGGNDTFAVDVASYAASQDRKFAKPATDDAATADNKVSLIYQPEVVNTTGEFTVISAEFSDEVIAPTEVVKEITATDTKVGTDWYSQREGEYTTTVDNGVVKIDYKKQDAYSAVRAYVKGSAIATMKSITFTLNGPQGKKALLKPFDVNIDGVLKETSVTFSGKQESFTIDISRYVTDKTFDEKVPICIIMEPGDNNVGNEGHLDIINVEFSTDAAPVTEVENTITVDNRAIANNTWYDSGSDVYTTTPNADGSVKVAFQKNGGGYPSVYALVKGADLGSMKSIKFVVKGTKGTNLLLKPFDKNECQSNVSLGDAAETEAGQTFIVDISSYVNGKSFETAEKIHIMAEGGDDKTDSHGEFTLVSVEFSTKTDGGAPDYDANYQEIKTGNLAISKWIDGGDKLYTIEDKQADGVQVTVHKTGTGGEWASIKSYVYGEYLRTVGALRLVVTGTQGNELLIKPFNEGALEQRITLTGEEQTIEFDLYSYVRKAERNFSQKVKFSNENQILIFALPEKNTGELTFTIKSATFLDNEVTTITDDSKTITTRWYSNDLGVYKFETATDGTKVNYKKTNQEWSFMFAYVKGDAIKNYDTITFVIHADKAMNCTFKPFNQGDKHVDLEEGDNTIECTYDQTVANGLDTSNPLQIIIFAEGPTATAEGSLTIKSVTFSKAAA